MPQLWALLVAFSLDLLDFCSKSFSYQLIRLNRRRIASKTTESGIRIATAALLHLAHPKPLQSQICNHERLGKTYQDSHNVHKKRQRTSPPNSTSATTHASEVDRPPTTTHHNRKHPQPSRQRSPKAASPLDEAVPALPSSINGLHSLRIHFLGVMGAESER